MKDLLSRLLFPERNQTIHLFTLIAKMSKINIAKWILKITNKICKKKKEKKEHIYNWIKFTGNWVIFERHFCNSIFPWNMQLVEHCIYISRNAKIIWKTDSRNEY